MEIIWKEENGPALIEPTIFRDDRGYFFESFNAKEFAEKVIPVTFVQDNQSKSSYGVLRGMHFQQGEYAQAKLVRVISGAVVDVVVDIRKESPNFGKVYSAYLSEENMRQLFVPRGFAHGFVTLRDNTVFQYKCDNFYHKASEGAFSWDSIGFDWSNLINLNDVLLSEKDKRHVSFAEFAKMK